MNTGKVSRLGVAGIVIGALGVVTPIVWDRVKTRSSIELRLRASITLLQADPVFGDLNVSYGGRQIDGITKLDFTLTNNGRTPITSADVVDPPTISLAPEGFPLDVAIQTLQPANLVLNHRIDTLSRRVQITFPLLNPGDRVSFSILVAGNVDSVRADARIAGIGALDFVDDRSTEEDHPPSRLSTSVIIVAIFSGLGVVGLLGILVQSGEERQLRQLLFSGYLMLPQRGTKEDYERFVASTLTSKSASELKKLRALIAALPDSTDATADQDRDLHQAAIDAVSNLQDVQLGIGCVAVFVVIGLVYVAIKLFM